MWYINMTVQWLWGILNKSSFFSHSLCVLTNLKGKNRNYILYIDVISFHRRERCPSQRNWSRTGEGVSDSQMSLFGGKPSHRTSNLVLSVTQWVSVLWNTFYILCRTFPCFHLYLAKITYLSELTYMSSLERNRKP